jgi:hypothetical protein
MFLRRNLRDRAIGLAAAYAVVCLGIFVTAKLDARPRVEPAQATRASIDRAETGSVDRCDIVC